MNLEPSSVFEYLLQTGQDCPWLPGNGCAMYANEEFTSRYATLVFLTLGIPSFVIYAALFFAFIIGWLVLVLCLSYLGLVLTWKTLALPFRIYGKRSRRLEHKRKRNERFERMTPDEFSQYLQKLEARR